MAKNRISLINPRSIAFSRQNGRCYYCRELMWSDNPNQFASKHNISIGQAKQFMCTGEHLIAHHQGGSAKQKNIVAACWFCNQNRHRRKEDISPQQYKKLVQNRMIQGRWHNVRLN